MTVALTFVEKYIPKKQNSVLPARPPADKVTDPASDHLQGL